MRDRSTEFGDARIAVVTFARPEMARLVAPRYAPLPVVIDEDRQAYRTFGFERGRLGAVWAPRVLLTYARLLRRGARLSRPSEDTRQLGGDVVIDADGRLRLLHRSEDPTDRPSVEDLLDAVRARDPGR